MAAKRAKAFHVGDKVLSFHGPLVYEAKVNDMRVVEGEQLYYLHYLGWSDRWDEWVPEERMMVASEANMARQADMVNQHKISEARKSMAGQPGSLLGHATHRPEQQGKKRKYVEVDEEDVEATLRPELRLALPNPLKKLLVEDWERATRLSQIATFPQIPNARSILAMYLKESKSRSSAKEFVEGLTLYFNRCCRNLLCYRQEIPTLVALKDQEACDVFGVAHLVRLLTKLPMLLSHTSIEEDAVAKLQEEVAAFTSFLVAHKELLEPVETADSDQA